MVPPTFLHRIKIRQALKTKTSPDFTTQFGHYEKSPLAEIMFIHLYPLIFQGFFLDALQNLPKELHRKTM